VARHERRRRREEEEGDAEEARGRGAPETRPSAALISCVGVVCVKEVRVERSRREACVVLVYETVAPVERATDVESDPAHARLVDRLVSASSARAPPCAGLRYHSCAHLKSAQVLTLRTVCAWHCAGSRMQIRCILENAMALRCRSCALATSRGICSLHPSHVPRPHRF